MDDSPSEMTISQRIKDAIKASGLNLNKIASETGVAQPILWRFMATDGQHRDIRLERTADKLAAYFGLDLTPIRGRQPPSSGGSVPLAKGSKKAKKNQATSGGSAAGEVANARSNAAAKKLGRLAPTKPAAANKLGQGKGTGRGKKR